MKLKEAVRKYFQDDWTDKEKIEIENSKVELTSYLKSDLEHLEQIAPLHYLSTVMDGYEFNSDVGKYSLNHMDTFIYGFGLVLELKLEIVPSPHPSWVKRFDLEDFSFDIGLMELKKHFSGTVAFVATCDFETKFPLSEYTTTEAKRRFLENLEDEEIYMDVDLNMGEYSSASINTNSERNKLTIMADDYTDQLGKLLDILNL